MKSRDQTLLAEIEAAAVDSRSSLADALRKCVVLGGKSGSEQLRDWATRELQGYYGEDELPEYRTVAAQIQIDGATMTGLISQQAIAPTELPDFVQEKVKEQVDLRDGVGAIEALVSRAESQGEAVKFSLPLGADIARVMSGDMQGQRILSIYWAVAPGAIHGLLDQIRTALTVLVAEMRANMPRNQEVPSEAVANQAINLVVTGRRHKISVSAAQATEESAQAHAAGGNIESPDDSPFWTTPRKIGAFIVGVATIVGAVAAVLAL